MKFFKHGEKVVVSKSHDNHAIGKIAKLSENEELVRLQSGELRIFHYSKITTPEAHAKRKAKS